MMPQIELVDLKDKYFRKKMNGICDDLIQSITDALVLGEQVIFLFQNRSILL
jgi:primosomal protein N' (replication factor Y)